MKHLFLLSFLLLTSLAQAQDVLSPSRVRWTAPLSASTVKTVIDASGNTWSLSGPSTFQVLDSQGKPSWTKTVSALTVADFTIDNQGQLLLVGLPSTGRPVVEKYDATQTLTWRNTLDSLSNVPGQATNLSITTNPLGSGLVLGVNASSNQKLSYYFFTAGGQLSAPVSITGTKQAAVSAIRPVLINTNDMLLGIHQPQTPDATPVYYQILLGATKATPVPLTFYQDPRAYAFIQKKYYSSPTLIRSLPLLSDGKSVYPLIRADLDTTGNKTVTPKAGYAMYYLPEFSNAAGTFYSYLTTYSYANDDVRSVGEASSRFLDSQGRLFTTQFLSSTTTTTSADVLLNQYTNYSTSIKPLVLLSSLKVGTVVQSNPTSSFSQTNRLTVLNRNGDGSIVLTGTTSGTMTIGSSIFTGTPAAPAQFVVTIAPETPAQTLTADQISWTVNLPAGVRRIRANDRQQTWVQLPDSVYRYYDSKGKLVWEKKLVTQGINEIGADLKGNLYIMSADSVHAFDSTGTFRWKLVYTKGPGIYAYNKKLYIKPTGGGVAACITDLNNGNQRVTEFTNDGKEIGQFQAWSWAGSPRDSYILANIAPLSSKQMAWFFTYTSSLGLSYTGFPLIYKNATASSFVRDSLKWKTYSIPNMDPYNPSSDTLTYTVRGLHIWSKAATNAVYLFQSQNAYLPSIQTSYRYGYSLTKFDSTGRTIFDEVNTIPINNLALAKSVALNPASTLFALQTSFRAETNTTTSYDLVLNQYGPDINLRNTTRLGTFTLVNGQPDKTSWGLTEAYTDGSLLLSGLTSGTLTIGTNTFMGSATAPVRFLALINTTVAQVIAPTTAVCQGSSATIKARYKGYIAQVPVVQLSNAAGSFAQPALSLSVPLSQSTLTDTTLSSLSLPIPATLAAGTYQVRTLLGTLVSPLTSLTILATPAATTVTQQGDELVSSSMSTGTLQWYDAQNKPITGATEARYKPQMGGSYYVVNTANGCASAPSNAFTYVILATEPLSSVVLYPNPATDQLLVRWPGAGNQARIKLLDPQGRVVQEVARQGEVTRVSTQGLAPGLVLVQLVAEGQAAQVHKVLIQR